MDDTIDYSIVFAKTQKGVAEINARSGALTLQARRVLIMIDGRRPVAELMAVVRSGEFDGIISQLETHGMIDKVDLSSLPSRDYEAEDFADTISLLQENATALRSMPHISPAELAANAQAARTAAASGEQREEAANDAAAIAARAVASASASAPRTIEAAMRRPPTISIASPVAQEMASGTARPGTINVPLRTTEPPVRRPPTLSGVRPAPVAEHGNAAVEAPVRPVVAEKAPARIEPAAAPAPAPAPAANTPVRSFEEEKRHAVKELYAVLGPYGEQPVAALQECKTIEALREQIKQAGRRVVTFRGEKAAQDFLRAVGQA